jgi:hypothetical protein
MPTNTQASIEIAAYIKEVLEPPTTGATLGAIVGAYVFKAALRKAGYAVVPLTPTAEMRRAFKQGWGRGFMERYASMLEASWPEDEDDIKQLRPLLPS